MASPETRVRFAPSPTGYLHIGGARTAFFNWLFARRFGGKLILRIEDTDLERSTEESMGAILESMKWLGLDWDEGPEVGGPSGPYRQTERLATYRTYADRLVAEGKAYRCFTTREELDALKAKLPEKERERFVFKSPWREKGESDWLQGAPYVVRFKTDTTGVTTYKDEVFGEITTPNNSVSIQDFVLIRSDGVPLYNFGAVVDDIEMGITLVARGRDHMVNTPHQVMLYAALGKPTPRFAHLPMMLAPDGKKLSKRNGTVSVTDYREQGYSPAGLLNYLVRFGWSHGDQEVFSLDEMIQHFDFAHVNRSDGKFDAKKALSTNHQHLKSAALTPDDRYLEQLAPFLAKRGIAAPDTKRLRDALATVRERARTYVEAADMLDFYFRDEPVFDEKARASHLTPTAAPRLRALAREAAAAEPFAASAIEARVHAWLEGEGLAIKDVAQAARVALTGRAASPALFDVMAVLGRETTSKRLEQGARMAEQAASA